MILPLNLNRRHKVTLFLTVLLAGIAALSGAKMMQVVGILLLVWPLLGPLAPTAALFTGYFCLWESC